MLTSAVFLTDLHLQVQHCRFHLQVAFQSWMCVPCVDCGSLCLDCLWEQPLTAAFDSTHCRCMLLLIYRFKGLSGIVAFDLDSFLSMAQRSRKWQDPHTLKNVTIKQLQLDSWMQPILTCLKVCHHTNTSHTASLKHSVSWSGAISKANAQSVIAVGD